MTLALTYPTSSMTTTRIQVSCCVHISNSTVLYLYQLTPLPFPSLPFRCGEEKFCGSVAIGKGYECSAVVCEGYFAQDDGRVEQQQLPVLSQYL